MANLLPEALSTLPNLKEALGVSGGDNSQDDRLKNILNRVTLWVEHTTKRKLVCRNYNGKGTTYAGTGVVSEDYLYLDGHRQVEGESGTGEIYLPAYPVQRTATGALTFALAVIQARA